MLQTYATKNACLLKFGFHVSFSSKFDIQIPLRVAYIISDICNCTYVNLLRINDL